ncbi:MAG: hypothetical protein ACYDAS_00400 [Patescibacteria group bacterium]
MEKKNKNKKRTKEIVYGLLLFIIAFLITTSFLITPKNSNGNIITLNVYIVVTEIFFILFFFITFFVYLIKPSTKNLIKNSIIIPLTISIMILLRVFGELDILMIFVIPITAIILYFLISII